MSSISPTMLKNGQRILLDGDVYVVVEFAKQAMGRGRGRVVTKLRHIVNGKVIERTFRSTDEVEIADAEFRDMQFLYKEKDRFVFMDIQTYDQQEVDEELVGFGANFLTEGCTVKATIFEGAVISTELPPKMDFIIADTHDAVKGNTANNVTKDAKIETGFTVKVPLFIKMGDKIRVKTETGEYVERVN